MNNHPTCTLCFNEGIVNYTLLPQYLLCTKHYNQWSATGTYREETVTGTYVLPEWVRGIIAFHNNDERKMYHAEMTFSDLQDEEEKPVRGIPTLTG